MAKDLNQCNFIGRLGKDPEIRYMPNGDAVVSFSIACGDDYKNKQGEKVEQTNWVNLVAFRRTAEVIGEYCKKGSKIFVTGKLTTRKWQDKETGADRYTTEIIVNEMQMLDGKGAGSGERDAATGSQRQRSQQNTSSSNVDGVGDEFEDDIPF